MSSKIDKIDMMYDIVNKERDAAIDFRKEVMASHKETGEKLNKLETNTIERLTKIESTNEVQNRSLDEHIAGVNTLKKLHQDNVDRITENRASIVVLEEPGKVRRSLRDKIIMTGKVVGAIATICGAAAYFLGLF